MEKISILTPTRNRPDFVRQLIETAIQTAKYPKLLEFVFYIDEDDQLSQEYFKQLQPHIQESNLCELKVISGGRIVLSEMWNRCWEVSTGTIYVHCGDDLRFRTSNWDQIIRDKFEEYPDKIVFLFGNDGHHAPGHFGTHGFLHKNWTDAVGYFVPPYFSSDYNDAWLNDVAKEIGRWVYVDIYTEHMHPAAGKYHWDKTHQERLVRHSHDNVDQLYRDKAPQRQLDCIKLKQAIENYENSI